MAKIKVMMMIWSMGAGGAQQVCINYLKSFLDDPDIDLRLYVFTASTGSKYDAEIKEKGYPVVYLNEPKTRCKIPFISRLFQLCVTQRAWRHAIHNFQPDIVHVHISALFAHVLKPIRQEHIKTVFDTLHSHPERYSGWRLNRIKTAFNKDGVIPICLNESQAKIAQKHYGIDQYEIVYNGLYLDRIRECIVSKSAARKQICLPGTKDSYIVLACGRLDPIKNYTFLVRVFSRILQERRDSYLIFAGDGPEKNALESLVEAFGIKNNVVFLGDVTNVVPLYCASDVLAVTSISESSSLVAIEAQTCGTRCVLSSGVPDESIVSSNAYKMDANASVDDWSKALLDSSLRRKTVVGLENYDMKNVKEHLKEVYLKYWNSSSSCIN